MFIHLSTVFIQKFTEILGVFRLTFRLCGNRLRGNQKVGMFRPKVCAQRNDPAIAEAGGPQGPEAHTGLLRLSEKQLNSVCPQSRLLCGQTLHLLPFCAKTVRKMPVLR
jgi:hypothetical protein